MQILQKSLTDLSKAFDPRINPDKPPRNYKEAMKAIDSQAWAAAYNSEYKRTRSIQGLLVELVEQQPATRCVVGSIPAGSALEVWPWTSVLNSLVGL